MRTFGPFLVRLLFAAPTMAFLALQCFAQWDVESFLSKTFRGRSMPDAFNHLNKALPIFTIFLFLQSLLAYSLMMSSKLEFLIPLATGPVLGGLCYLLRDGVSDPNWCELFAILIIGMLVSIPVTLILVGIRANSNRTLRSG